MWNCPDLIFNAAQTQTWEQWQIFKWYTSFLTVGMWQGGQTFFGWRKQDKSCQRGHGFCRIPGQSTKDWDSVSILSCQSVCSSILTLQFSTSLPGLEPQLSWCKKRYQVLCTTLANEKTKKNCSKRNEASWAESYDLVEIRYWFAMKFSTHVDGAQRLYWLWWRYSCLPQHE